MTCTVQAHPHLKDAIQKNYLLLNGFPEYIGPQTMIMHSANISHLSSPKILTLTVGKQNAFSKCQKSLIKPEEGYECVYLLLGAVIHSYQ